MTTFIHSRRTHAALSFVAVSASIALAACSSKDAAVSTRGDTAVAATGDSGRARDVVLTPAQSAKIRVAPVQMTAFRAGINTTGTVAFNGDRSTQVLAPVSGPITRILVNPGAYVRRGQPLAMVTSPDYAAASAGYRKALSAYRNAQRIADVDEKLFQNDAIPRRELEQAQTDAAAAAADRDAALEQMRALGVEPDGGGAATGQAVIRAPIEGTVVEKLVNPGQLIQAGTTQCFTIADLSTVWVMANVFESDVAGVASGEAATITTAALPQPVTGQVTYVGSLVDPASKATAVRILVPNPRGLLKRDMLVNVAIRSSQGRNGLLIPTSAVLRDDDNLPFVYVALPNGHFVRRSITLGTRNGDNYEVSKGVIAGERIVIDGALFLNFAENQ